MWESPSTLLLNFLFCCPHWGTTLYRAEACLTASLVTVQKWNTLYPGWTLKPVLCTWWYQLACHSYCTWESQFQNRESFTWAESRSSERERTTYLSEPVVDWLINFSHFKPPTFWNLLLVLLLPLLKYLLWESLIHTISNFVFQDFVINNYPRIWIFHIIITN